jgi:uncharacterized membrane protein YjjP (DUF1212 family)
VELLLADTALLTMGDRTVSFSRTPIVPALDQVADLEVLVLEVLNGDVPAEGASRRLDALHRRPPVFSRAWQVVGLVLFATGFGISVQATGQEIVASAVLGLFVGLIAVTAQTRPRLALAAPFVCSVAVSTLALNAYKEGWIEGGPIQLIVPCLFFFIPGDAISAGMLELATPGSHGLRGFESRFGGHPIEGFKGLSDIVALFTALAVGMLVGPAAVRR